MSTETLNRTSAITETYINKKVSTKQDLTPNKVNIDVLKKRVIVAKKKEALQSKIILLTFCISLGILGYLVG